MTPDHGEDVDKQESAEPVPTDDVAETVEDGAEEQAQSMGDLLADADLAKSLKAIRPGEIVKGTVVEVRADEVVVHVGGKYEGVIPLTEFPSPAEVPAEGNTIDVAVVRVSDDEGHVQLSKKKADYEAVWTRILQALETKETVTAMVTERVKGGLRVDLGVSGFVPASQVSTRNVRDLDRFVGRSLRLRIIEADRRDKKVILSHRQVVEEERAGRRAETLARLTEGMVCEGKVRNITDYGAFVDLGGVDGLLHISEMAWTRVKHPSEVVKVGETLQVAIIGIDREKDRISLSRRECLPDPWNEAGQKLRPGTVVKARITRLAKNGAFAAVEGLDVEGFIPISELADRRISEPGEVIQADQEVDLKVISLRPQERRMTLSLAEAVQEKERQEYREYMQGQDAAKPTLGDQFGDLLAQVQTSEESEAKDAPAEEPEEEPAATDEPAADEEAPEPDAPAEEETPPAEEPEEEPATTDEPAADEEAPEPDAPAEEETPPAEEPDEAPQDSGETTEADETA